MRTHLISYATDNFRNSQKLLAKSAIEYGLDVVWSFTRQHLMGTPFYQTHKTVLDASRGAGYWLWKPYLLASSLAKLDYGDLLVYCDAGLSFVADPAPLLEICQRQSGFMLFHAHYDDVGAPGLCVNSRWTKRDCFIRMGCDEEKYWSARHLDASFQIYQKNEQTIQFIDEYLGACIDPCILSDAPNTCSESNRPEYLAHREDQSVLSLLSVKYGLEIFRHPSQYGNYLKLPEYRRSGEAIQRPYSDAPYENSPYPMILDHHRKQNCVVAP